MASHAHRASEGQDPPSQLCSAQYRNMCTVGEKVSLFSNKKDFGSVATMP